MLQSMVWCNELVVLLARLLQTIAQPSVLKLHSQAKAQQQILRQMEQAVQPSVASAFSWGQPKALSIGKLDANAQHNKSLSVFGCPVKMGAVGAETHVLEDQLLVINKHTGGRCTNK